MLAEAICFGGLDVVTLGRAEGVESLVLQVAVERARELQYERDELRAQLIANKVWQGIKLS